ncbi:hypothetical protein LZ31DRAFT_393313 [Colletotrichum somersetense]|nr:hypothetical protein LZ31DRAFT_393313 [Colletotrichum somersetense]
MTTRTAVCWLRCSTVGWRGRKRYCSRYYGLPCCYQPSQAKPLLQARCSHPRFTVPGEVWVNKVMQTKQWQCTVKKSCRDQLNPRVLFVITICPGRPLNRQHDAPPPSSSRPCGRLRLALIKASSSYVARSCLLPTDQPWTQRLRDGAGRLAGRTIPRANQLPICPT